MMDGHFMYKSKLNFSLFWMVIFYPSLLLLIFSEAACTKPPHFMETKATATLKHDFGTRPVVVKSEDNGLGVSVAEIKADTQVTQVVSASATSEIAGTEIQVTPGALALSANIGMEAGANIASSALSSELGLETPVTMQPASTAVVLSSSVAQDFVQPVTLAISLNSSGSLRLIDSSDPYELLIIVYKVFKASEGTNYVGIIPRSELRIENGKVLFDTMHFGSFQAAYTDKKVEAVKESVTTTQILTKNEEKTLEPIVWETMTSSFNSATRKVTFSTSATGFSTVEKCSLIIDKDQNLPWDKITPANGCSNISSDVLSTSAHQLYGKFECTDSTGRTETSPWSEVVSIPQELPNAPTKISATKQNYSAVISWTAVSDAVSYNIYWGTKAPLTTKIATKISNVSSPYTHKDLKEGTTYYYLVTAVNSRGEGSPTSVSTAVFIPYSPLLVTIKSPENEEGSVEINSPIVVTFSDLINTTTINSTNFLVQDISSKGTISGKFTISADQTTVTFTPTNYLPYQSSIVVTLSSNIKCVRSRSFAGASWSFATESAPYTPPSTPSVIDTYLNSYPSKLSPDNTPTFAFSSNFSGVSFRCQFNSDPIFVCTSPYTPSALDDGVYDFFVFAVDSSGNIDSTPASYNWSIDAHAPAAASNFSATPGNGQVSLSWTHSGADVAEFIIEISGSNTYVELSSSMRAYVWPNLTNGTQYTFWVLAVDNAGNFTSTYTLATPSAPNASAIFPTSLNKVAGQIISITSSGNVSNNIWFAPSGTTTFSEGASMTKAASGTATSILTPLATGNYQLYVLDSIGNISSISSATLTVVSGYSCSVGSDCESGICSSGTCVMGCNVIYNGSAEYARDGWVLNDYGNAQSGSAWEVQSGYYCPDDNSSKNSWATTYYFVPKSQDIDLLAKGFSQSQLNMKPDIYIQDWYIQSGYANTNYYYLFAEVKDASNQTIASFSTGSESYSVVTNSWQKAYRTFTLSDYGSAIPQKIYFLHEGKDSLGWAGNYGPIIGGARITVKGFPCPNCNDGYQNRDETGVDCGGTYCAPCP